MKSHTKNVTLSILILIALSALSGCGMFKKGGADLVEGASTKIDSLGRKLIIGIREELTDSLTRVKLSRFLDSLVVSLIDSANPKVTGLRDSLFNDKVLQWSDSLVEVLTGSKLQLHIKELQAALIGKTKEDVFEMRNSFRDLLNEILSDTTKDKVGKIRDELLGAKTDSAITRIVDNAMIRIAGRYKSDLAPAVKEDVSFIRKNASALLFTLGGISAFIILFVWWNKRKYLRMVTLLTKHIHNIPDQNVYDLVTHNIKQEAITTGLEPELRKTLDKNGLLGKENWDNKINKLKSLQ